MLRGKYKVWSFGAESSCHFWLGAVVRWVMFESRPWLLILKFCTLVPLPNPSVLEPGSRASDRGLEPWCQEKLNVDALPYLGGVV